MLRKRFSLLLAVALFAASLVAAGPAAAITGDAEVSDRDYVGLVVFYVEGEDDEEGLLVPSHRCSGSLLSATVFLTAGHCTFETVAAQVWFEQGPIPFGTWDREGPCLPEDTGYPCAGGVMGTPHTFPGYDEFATFPNTGDVGVVVLDQAVSPDAGFAALAVAGSLDRFATERGRQDVTVTVVGYGLQSVVPTLSAELIRLEATGQIVNLTSALTAGFNVQTIGPGKGSGGTCFGDSGGPVLYSDTDIIVGITSFGLNAQCAGVDFAYRTDQQAVINWILTFDGSIQVVTLA